LPLYSVALLFYRSIRTGHVLTHQDLGGCLAYAEFREANVNTVPSLLNSPQLKRLFDVVIASSLLLLTAPIAIVTAGLVALFLGRPVLFRQRRPGSDERIFTLCKFRTMRNAFDAHGEPLSDAERLTAFGRFLRSTSLDEIPQLWNILRGDMSLVGPRPLLPEYLPLYTTEQRRRHAVRPGITGLAQVLGRNSVSWEERFRLDVRYVEERTLGLDLWILWQTLFVVVGRRGIVAEGQVSMSKFQGLVD